MSIQKNLSELWAQKPSLWREDETKIREELGDEIDVFALKNLQNHVLLYNPAILSTIYNSTWDVISEASGEWTEDIGLSSFFREEFTSLGEEKKNKIMKSLVEEHVNAIIKKLGLGHLSLQKVDFEEQRIKVIVNECVEAHEASTIGHSICFNMAAILGGEIGSKFSDWKCFEKECKANGFKNCKFVIAPQERINEELREFLDLPAKISFTLKGKITSMISEFRRKIDYTLILEESTNRVSYILPNMESKERPKLGNEMHVRGFQQYYLSFLNENLEKGSETLYEAGFLSGERFSRILSAMGMRNRDKLNLLPRLFDRLGIGLMEIKKEQNRFNVKIKECAYSYSLNTEEKICYFNSGFLSGLISSIEGEKFRGQETKCSGVSGEFCVHSIESINHQEDSE